MSFYDFIWIAFCGSCFIWGYIIGRNDRDKNYRR